ncbi:MAG: hypothetical protein ACYC0V_19385 [Armatimonadota bacterium]
MDYALIVRWGAPIIGILALVYVFVFNTRLSGDASGNSNRLFKWPIVISLIIAAVTTYFIIIKAPTILPWAIFIGWGLTMVLFITQSLINRKYISQTNTNNMHKAVLASVFASASIAILGVSAGPYIKGSITVSVEDTFIVIVLGFWMAALFCSLPAALNVRVHEDENANEVSSPGLVLRSLSTVIMFLIVAAIGVCITLATYRFEEKNLFGLQYPVAVFAASLFFALLMVPLLKPFSAEAGINAKFIIRRTLGVVLFIAGTGLSAYYLAVHALLDVRGFYCFGVGLAASMVITMLNRLSDRSGGIFGKELAVIEILMALGATILSFRWMTGYGAALCSIGFLASLPIIIQVRSFQEHDQYTTGTSRGTLKYMEPALSISSYLILIAMLRLFTERMGISSSGINIAEPYSLIGLTIGGIFPLMMGALLRTESSGVSQVDAAKSSSFGKKIAFRTLGVFLLIILIPLLIAVFWRVKAAGGFIAGLAVSELFLIVRFYLGEKPGKSDEDRYDSRVNPLFALGSALMLIQFTPMLIDMTGTLTRYDKIIGLCILMGILLIAFVIIISRKLYSIRHG